VTVSVVNVRQFVLQGMVLPGCLDQHASRKDHLSNMSRWHYPRMSIKIIIFLEAVVRSQRAKMSNVRLRSCKEVVQHLQAIHGALGPLFLRRPIHCVRNLFLIFTCILCTSKLAR
jgi:hypothetical protein